ncbi:MAG: hypothetical protein DHS20C08_15410 [Rhodomicrobium sp.]|nr:MAG: hypothetical protein DHS20C08_15410 [Rhodomicrobium sp.]
MPVQESRGQETLGLKTQGLEPQGQETLDRGLPQSGRFAPSPQSIPPLPPHVSDPKISDRKDADHQGRDYNHVEPIEAGFLKNADEAVFNENNLTVFQDTTSAHMPPPLSFAPPSPPEDESDDEYADEQISSLFTAMGRASQLTQDVIAIRLQTSSEVIHALEAGHLSKLPEWEELSSLVERYAAFMTIDERPILRRLREQLTEHYLTQMSRQKEQQGLLNASPMPMSDARLADFANNGTMTAAANSFKMPAISLFETDSPAPDANYHRNDLQPPFSSTASAEIQKSVQHSPQMFEQAALQSSKLSGLQTSSNHKTAQDMAPRKAGSRDVSAHDVSSSSLKSNIPPVTGAEHRLKPKAQQLQAAAQVNGLPPHLYQSGQMPQNGFGGQSPQGMKSPIATQHYEQPRVDMMAPQSAVVKGRLPLLMKIAANAAFLIILLFAFIQWQPNRFWSGVDQLPKPIANSIYDIFELVMPDPLAMSYRMNWVLVDDPRMRKADRLPVPPIQRLPAIDFSNLSIYNK